MKPQSIIKELTRAMLTKYPDGADDIIAYGGAIKKETTKMERARIAFLLEVKLTDPDNYLRGNLTDFIKHLKEKL